jgi:hypothetical protein
MTRLIGLKKTGAPSDDGSGEVDVAFGINVAGMLVAEAGTWVGSSDTRFVVFAGAGSVLEGGVKYTFRSHANVATINRDRDKNSFFIVEFLSCHSIKGKLPNRIGKLGSFLLVVRMDF